VPTGPGLGIAVDESRIKAMVRRYDTNGSFLQMITPGGSPP
jgi:hypothetical protein